jgi:hypothetical protein
VAALTSITSLREEIYKNSRVRHILRWMDAMAHPPLAIEISRERIAAARWSRNGTIEDIAVVPVSSGAIVPSLVETNLADVAAVRTALGKACGRLRAKNEEIAVLLPDPVIRVFVQKFEEFPRATSEALALLRWKLRKSVPFDGGEMWMSYMKRPARGGGVNVAAALARLRIVREYEELVKSVDLHAGIIMSSSLAAVALLEETPPTLLARISDGMLTITVVRDGELCVYRCTELPAQAAELTPQMLLDEIFPVAAYFQDVWKEGIHSLLLGGLGGRLPEFVTAIQNEFHCKVESPFASAMAEKRIPVEARLLVEKELVGLVGWMMNRV